MTAPWRPAAALAALLILAGCAGSPDISADAPVPSTLTATAAPTPTRPAPAPPATAPTRAARPGPGERPNIVLITTDDQAATDMRWMPRTARLLGKNGASYTEAIAPHPLCCPARAILLTGQYAHNNGVRTNKGRYGGYQRLNPDHTLATWLHAAGYRTAFVGKYLNEYPRRPRRTEPGWDIWNPTIAAVYKYYDFTMYNNGRPRTYTGVNNADVVGAKTTDYIKRFARSDKPFFVWASHVAPHGACVPSAEQRCWQEPVPAARHRNLFADTAPPSLRHPAYDEADVTDKPSYVAGRRPVTTSEVRSYFTARIRSLQAVDEAVADTVAALKAAGELDNTLIVFTSDNGFLLGEHRLTKVKTYPYEEALKVPMLIRGPRIPADVERDTAATHVDLAATFLDVAHARADLRLDGVSLLPDLRTGSGVDRDTVLVQAGPETPAEEKYGWLYRGVRTDRYTYVYYPATGEGELYDRHVDPAQLVNVSGDVRYRRVEATLAGRVDRLGGCSGRSCARPFGKVPAPTLLR